MSTTPSSLRPVVLIVLVGLATGLATLLAQGVLDAEWNRLANSGAVWLLVGFFVGSVMSSVAWAAGAGIGTLLGAIAGYYLSAVLIAQAGVSMANVLIWSGVAIVGGPVYGIAGRWWRDVLPVRRSIAIGLAGGIVSGEGASTLIRIPDLARVGWIELGVGVVVVLLLGRSWRDRAGGLIVLPVVIALVVVAYQVLDWLLAVI